MIQRLIDKLCWRIVEAFPKRTRLIQTDGADYLLRFYIKHNGMFPGLYLHKFFRGDVDRDLHNHPWKWSMSFILTGGYVEERDAIVGIEVRDIRPGHFNFLSGEDFHRVHLTDPANGAWTLFCSGPEVQGWGFRDRDTGEYIPWENYLKGR